MTPRFETLSIYQGQTFRDRFLFVDADGVPIDLSAKTASMQARSDISSPTVLLDLSSADGTIELGADGILAFNVSAAATAALMPGVYDTQQWVYDLELVTVAATPIVDRVLTGVVVFYPEINRT